MGLSGMQANQNVSGLAFLLRLLPLMRDLDSVDKIYQLLLAMAAAGETLACRRAMLFVVNENEGMIRGRFGVAEKKAVPSASAPAKQSFEEKARAVFAVYEDIESNDLTVEVRSFSVPLTWHPSALVKAARTSYPVLAERSTTEHSSDPFFSFFEATRYVAVPITIAERTAAVFVVEDAGVDGESSVEGISILYSLAQQASAAAENLIDRSGRRRRSRIARKLQLTLSEASTPESLEHAMRLGLLMVAQATACSGCVLKDLTRQKTTHIKTVREYSPDVDDDDIAVADSFDAILDHAAGSSESLVGDAGHPLLSQAAARKVTHFFVMPLLAGDSVSGAVAVYRESEEGREATFSESDKAFIALCSWTIAAKLEAGQLQERVGRSEAFFQEVSANLVRERERSRLAERAVDFQEKLEEDLAAASRVLASKRPHGERLPKLREIVEGMMRYSKQHAKDTRAGESNYEMIDIFDLTRRLVQDWVAILDHDGVEITVRIPAIGPSLLMDPIKLSQAINNILRATASCLTKGDKMLVECSAATDRVMLCFADNGAGLPGDGISRLLMPFVGVEAGDEKKRALSLAGEIIQKHFGEIVIKSSMSWKTILVLSFPKGANSDRRATRRDRRRRNERRSPIASS
jgi:signal transduction histidine kinase